jgi:hypothetical protein
MFLHCLNHWKLETPTARKQQMSADELSAYKVQQSSGIHFKYLMQTVGVIQTKLPDPDPHGFGPPGSGSSKRFGSGSGSFPFIIQVLSGLKDC